MMKPSLYAACQRALTLVLVLALLCPSALASSGGYSTLEFGSRGSNVLKLQKALLTLGFDPGGTDGKFGRGTENAVILYQTARGLTADGKAGNLTQTQIYAEVSGAQSSTGSNASSGTGGATNPNTLKYGDSGSKVTELQTALVKLGYSTNGVDGSFGAGTKLAVISFQRAQGLTADGLAGAKTQTLLYKLAAQVDGSSSNANGADSSSNTGSSSSSNGASGSSGDGGFTRTLRKGYTGADVVNVQTRLQALGYYTGSLDGVYGTGSVRAVKQFQGKNALTADGLAGYRTFTKLFSSSAVAAGGSSGSAGDSSSGSSGGSSGSSSSDSSGSSNGSNSSDSSSSSSNSGSSSGTYITLRYGSTGAEVRSLQKALKALNYNVTTDGDYGALTQSAVTAFQKRNSLTADGVAGAGTQALLYSGNALAADPDADNDLTIPDGVGQASGPSTGSVKLLHWFNEVKPSVRAGQTITIFDPATSLQWSLKLYSLGRHADSEPKTLTDTQIMYKAFGNTNTWTPKPVYVKLPSGTWTLASMHNVPHLTGSISDNGFDGHLCVHFLRDMDECTLNDPNYGVQNQNAIRKKWKEMTGITVE